MGFGMVLLLCGAVACLSATPPHLIMILQDDLGWSDVGFHNPDAKNVSGNITALANDGIVLTRHYVFYWCSPTRRSFLTGRLPIHHGEMLSGDASDEIDLRWSIISEKLAPVGYKSHWIGKGHTGFKSMSHLPVNRGFDSHIGFLGGEQSYTSPVRWEDDLPCNNTEYSTTLYGDRMISVLQNHDPALPLFLYLPWQAVHAPYDQVPGWPDTGSPGTYRGMLWLADGYVGQMVQLLKQKSMWDNTLIVYSADNGGRGDGLNYPWRGEKRTNYEGGMRVAAFVSGGFVPVSVRGTTNDIRMHIVDWYPTFCNLAGVDPTDDPPFPPQEVPAGDPTPIPIPSRSKNSGPDWLPTTDIYGSLSWPGVDGVDVWNMLTHPHLFNRDSAHETIVLSHEVIIVREYKLMVAQRGNTHQDADAFEAGWRELNYTWVVPENQTCGVVDGTWLNTAHFVPCVFNLETDPREFHDLGPTNPILLNQLYKTLNDSWRTYYYSRTPSYLLGWCDEICANNRWQSMFNGSAGHGPICNVPECVPPPPSNECNWTKNMGLGGNSLGTEPAATKEKCCGLCHANVGCLAADWNNRTENGLPSDGPMCHLKDCNVSTCGTGRDDGSISCQPLPTTLSPSLSPHEQAKVNFHHSEARSEW